MASAHLAVDGLPWLCTAGAAQPGPEAHCHLAAPRAAAALPRYGGQPDSRGNREGTNTIKLHMRNPHARGARRSARATAPTERQLTLALPAVETRADGPESSGEPAKQTTGRGNPAGARGHGTIPSMEPIGRAISLFSGAGGLDLGAEWAGFEVKAAVELDKDAAATLEKNFDGLRGRVLQDDIFDVTTEQILDVGGFSRDDRPDLLIGGPPCTPFSKSGFWLDWKRDGLDETASLLQSYTRVLREAQPKAFVLENVYALTYNNRASRPAFERLLREIEEAGYGWNWKVLNAADHGVPQARPRLFVVGRPKGDKTPSLPDATHGGSWERRKTGVANNPHVTAGEALRGLVSDPEPGERMTGQWADLLPGIPPGGNYLHYTKEKGHPDPVFKWRSRYWSFLLKLDPNRPAPTIQAQPGPNVGPFHWENRRLRVAEIKRLFTFPDEFELVGNRASVQAQLGNSVPPRLAWRVIDEVGRLL